MDDLRRAFGDIARGYSAGSVLSRQAYIKHLSFADQIGFDTMREELYAEAKEDEIPTNEQRLISLKESGEWTDAMDTEISDLAELIRGMHDGKRKNTKFPSMIKEYNRKIDEEEKRYREKLGAKYQLLGLTCETCADQCVNDYYIYCNIYRDTGLHEKLFSESEFDYMGNADISHIVADYNRILGTCGDQTIKKLAMQPFFQRQFGLTGDRLCDFFGKAICDLTFFQVDLLRHGAHFRHIYQNHDMANVPKNVLEDPDLLTDYVSAADKGKEELQKQGAFEPGAVVVGLSKEDAKATGVKQQPNITKDIMGKFGGNVVEWAMKRGGT